MANLLQQRVVNNPVIADASSSSSSSSVPLFQRNQRAVAVSKKGMQMTSIHTTSPRSNTNTTNNNRGAPSTKNISKWSLVNLVSLGMCLWILFVMFMIVHHHSLRTSTTTPKLSFVRSVRNYVHLSTNNISASAALKETPLDFSAYIKSSHDLKQEFYQRYGGKDIAQLLFSKSIITFSPSSSSSSEGGDNNRYGLHHTAKRILYAVAKKQPFILAFGGYSITVGRGNYFNQSYPLVLESILKDSVKLLNIKHFEIRNAAIGGIPSFPYGWCLKNFLGEDSDVVSWDFSMNEGDSAEGLESYLRHSLSLSKSPMFIMYGSSSPSRLRLLQQYVDNGSIRDPIVINYDKNLINSQMALLGENLPQGFQKWGEWGSPPYAPGQGPWHLKFKEHEFIGWTLAMHFLAAMDLAVEKMMTAGGRVIIVQPPQTHLHKPIFLSDQKSSIYGTEEVDSISSLIYGIPIQSADTSAADKDLWTMTRVSCRTSFQHSIQGPLDDIVVSGVAPLPDGLDPAITAQDIAVYSTGWVFDVGELERRTKRQLIPFGGLGYIDKKTALYGTYNSGTLRLWLPITTKIKTLVVCEVNEKRGAGECSMIKDLTFVVGGSSSPSKISQLKRAGTEYLGKAICVSVSIPKDALLTPRPRGVQTVLSSQAIQSLKNYDDTSVNGVSVDVTVTGMNVTYQKGACSISHVIWEEMEK